MNQNKSPYQTASPSSKRSDRTSEERLYGLNACLAAFAQRPDALRKVYLTEARVVALKPVLAWCVKHRLGYRLIEEEDLEKLTASRHHEGVCFEMLRRAPLTLTSLLAKQPDAPTPSLLLWLDGVGNPHNFGAVLRSAAHFGVKGIILPATSTLTLSAAAARIAEGGGEVVDVAQAYPDENIADSLHKAGYAIAATVPHCGLSLYTTQLPSRLVLIFGAENEGMSEALIRKADLRLTIPGNGAIESLNIAASVSVMLGEFWRQHMS